MKFSEYKYERPNFNLFKENVEKLIEKLHSLNNDKEIEKIINQFLDLTHHVESMFTIGSIRYNVNTNDDFYKNEYEFINEYSPLFQDVYNDFYKVVVNKKSPYLEEKFSSLFFKMLENKERIFSKDIILDLQEENNLVNQYDKIMADAKIEFRGQTYTLPQMKVFTSSVDRLTRKEASINIDNFLASKSAEIDDIYDKLVKVRTKIANKLGFENYVELGYLNLNRFNYNYKDVSSYRKNILKYVVPLANKLRYEQAKRINILDPEFYDYNLNFLDGNPTPKGNREELVEKALNMYSELSLETKEFFEFMTNRELLDLDSKHGKVGGGYCTFIPDYNSPFIFANFNTTAGDVEVLTHEAGHAFEVYTANKFLDNKEMLWPTLEACEIHSMSMEFLTYPWMKDFFEEDLEKFKQYHISSAITFIPYGALVDHFQHFVYQNPNATKEERKQEWRRLEKEYLPYRKYSDQPTFESGTYWYMQGHIFSSPFYYIDYTLAQVCALQYLILSLEDHNKAFESYYNLCKLGGSKSFLELIKSVNLLNPFEEDTLKIVMSKIEEIISKF